jgi:prevent-host-death family protein
MEVVTALEAKSRLGQLLEAAQRQPASITRNARPSVVMISAESDARQPRMVRVNACARPRAARQLVGTVLDPDIDVLTSESTFA